MTAQESNLGPLGREANTIAVWKVMKAQNALNFKPFCS